MCGDSNVAEKWINGHDAKGNDYRDTKWRNLENIVLMVGEERRVPP